MHERSSGAHEMNIGFIYAGRFNRKQTDTNFEARITQLSEATAGNLRVGIFNRGDNSSDAGFNQRLRARGSTSVVCMRLERDIGSGTARARAGLFQSHSLGVPDQIVEIKTFADDIVV